METLTSIIRTGSPILVGLIDLVNSFVIFLSQLTIGRWLTFILGSLTVTLTVLLFWIYLFLLMLVFFLQLLTLHWEIWLSHVVVSVSIDFLSNSQRDTPFHCVAYDYSRADWDGLLDHLKDVPQEDIFKLSAAASEFCEWVQVGIDVYIPHRKYQVKPLSSSWFSAACAAVIVHRNHFFCL